jgi:hypothetical protein
MGYLVQGNELQFLCAFSVPKASISGLPSISAAVSYPLGARFFGSEEHAQYYVNEWQKAHLDESNQENNCNDYLSHLFGLDESLRKKNESREEYRHHFVHQTVAYVSDKSELCHLMMMYRRDNPAQWMFGLIKNAHLEATQRTVICLSSFDLKPFMDSSVTLAVDTVSPLVNPLMEQINSTSIKNILSQALQFERGVINIRKLEHLTLRSRFIPTHRNMYLPNRVNTESLPLLGQENPTLDLVSRHQLTLSASMLKDCLEEQSGLRKEIETFPFSDDETLNKNFLEMLVVFYEEGILVSHREFLQDQIFRRTKVGSLWDSEQIKLIPFLIKKKYPLNLFHIILSQKAYYTAVYHLVQFGLTQDVPYFFANADKLKDLDLIHSLTNEDDEAKKLCLIFWVKSPTTSNYQQVVTAIRHYPLLAETLIALDQNRTHSMEELYQLALDPQEHTKHSLLYHYKKEFETFDLEPSSLDKFKERELVALSHCFQILKNTDKSKAETYRLIVTDTPQAQLARLFLPGLTLITNAKYQNELINILFLGIQNGMVSQDNAILAIEDEHLLALAKELQERFICVKQLLLLNFNNEIIEFAAMPDNPQAIKFRQVILNVKEQCKAIHHSLQHSSVAKNKRNTWCQAEEEYRKKLYRIVYNELLHPTHDLSQKLNKATANILKIVDPQIRSLVHDALVIIANLIIYLVTFGMAHKSKEKRTGNCWFFKHSRSGEEIKALNKAVVQIVEPPEEKLIPTLT